MSVVRPLILLALLALAACGDGTPQPPLVRPPVPDPPTAPTQYRLDVERDDAGHVRSEPAGIDCGDDCSEIYASGTAVQLLATAAEGQQFLAWSGDCAGSGPRCTLRMDGPRSTRARFAPLPPDSFVLTVSVHGAGSIASEPPGIACGTDCEERYPAGSAVRLIATADAGHRFAGWSGGCAGSAPECTLDIDRARSASARFEPLPPDRYGLTVIREGAGRVFSQPAGIDCGGDCQQDYARSSDVQLHAEADPGARFEGWSGDCAGSGACTVTMDASRTVGARFSAVPRLAPTGALRAGDMHVHTDHSSDGSALRQGLDGRGPGNVSVADQIGQGELAGLAWMPITDHRTYDQHYDPLWTSDALLLIPGEEANGSPHANVLGQVDTVVQGAVYPGRPGWSVLQTSIWDAHSQGAVWSHNHPDDGHVNEDGTPNERANAIGADVVEIWNKASGIETELRYAENRWNAGFRFGGVGASDNHFREIWGVAGPGTPATLLFSGAASERSLLQALAAGRTTITARNDGVTPVLTLEADGDGDGIYETLAGDELLLPAGAPATLRLRIQRGVGATVTLYRNPGRVAGAVAAEYTPMQLEEIHTLPVRGEATASWYYAELRGPGEVDAVNTADFAAALDPMTVSNARRAITSPVFLDPTPAVPQPAEALPADAGGEDGALMALGRRGLRSAFPDLAVVGVLRHVVAEQHEDGATRVLYRRIGADGSGAPAVDLAPASRSARFPRIAARGELVWVVWQDERAGQVPRRPAIYLRQSSDGGINWLPEQRLRAIEGRAERPVIAVGTSGGPVVAWQEIVAGRGFDVFVQQLGRDSAPLNVSGTGKTNSAGNPADTRSARTPASVWPTLAVRGDGLIALAYHDNRSDPDPLWTGQVGTGDSTDVDNWQLRVHTRAAAGSWNAGVALGADDHADRHPALAFAGDGTLVCTWDQKTLAASGANLSIRAAVSADGGASFATLDTVLGGDAGAFGQYPRLATDPDGRARVVWYDNRSPDWRWRVMTAVLDGGDWSTGTLLGGRGNNTWPALHGGQLAFASTRRAQRLQRDASQDIYLRPAP